MDQQEGVYIGYISRSRGLKGELQLYFEFDHYQELTFDTLFISLEKKLVPFFVKSYKLQNNKTGFFYLEDYDHIDKIQKLLHKEVYLSKDKLPEREAGEFFVEDLKGFLVIDEQHGELGEIIEIQELPQQDMAVVQYKFKELMFPIIDAFIVEINEEEHILRVDLPDGLVNLYKEEETE